MEFVSLSRREILAASLLGATFALAMKVPDAVAGKAEAATQLQPLLAILPSGRVQITALLADMGQGVYTSLPLILAEEMDVEWSQVDISLFNSTMAAPNVKDSGMFIAASSRSVRSWFTPLRECAARARMMLVQAAEKRWGVKPGSCRTAQGHVIHPNGRTKLAYAKLAPDAARLPVPTEVTLKPASEYRLFGKIKDRRDVPAKCTGEAVYASDVKLPGLKFASVTHGPAVGGKLVKYDEAAALALPRVERLLVIDGNTLVAIASDTWSAMRALEAAAPEYELPENADLDGSRHQKELLDALSQPGRTFDVKEDASVAPTAKKISVRYELPFLAHATMEPMSCTAWYKGETCEVWAPTQAVFRARDAAAKAVDLPSESVIVYQTLLGGGFGRRSEADFVHQSALISKLIGAPVRLFWSRQEDMQRDFYRPAYAFQFDGELSAAGDITRYSAKISGASIMRTRMPLFNGPNAPIDPTVRSQLVPGIYRLGNTKAAWSEVTPPVPVGYWRSVAHSQNTFAAESFIDELAHAAGIDPFRFRRDRITDPRMAAVADKVAELSNWSAPLPAGRGRGIALVSCYDSYFGQVIEASVENGEIRVHHVTNVIDCGLAIQPDNVIAQVDGGVVFGLSAALYGKVNLDGGRVSETSFGDYRVLSLPETPPMTTHILQTDNAPGGVGETSTPTCGPALLNALFAATGRRLRHLPVADAFY